MWGVFSLSFLFKFLDPLTGVEGPCDKNKTKSVSICEFSLGKGVYLLLHCERCLISVVHQSCFGFNTIYVLLLRNTFIYYYLMWFCLFVCLFVCLFSSPAKERVDFLLISL